MSRGRVMEILSGLDNIVESGGGANLRATMARMIGLFPDDDIYNLFRKAVSKGSFTGNFNGTEKTAMKRLAGETVGLWDDHLKTLRPEQRKLVRTSTNALFEAQKETSAKLPLIFDDTNPYSNRMRDLEFGPIPGQNYNKPGIVTKTTKSSAYPEYTPEFTKAEEKNLMAAWNLNPSSAADYSTFYKRVSEIFDKLSKQTGIPKERLAKIWGITSAQADPGANARKTTDILLNPGRILEGLDNEASNITNATDFKLSLQAAAGELDDPAAFEKALGRGKRFNFKMNSLDPSDPNYYTADTRNSQAGQGLMNTYKIAPYGGQFDPHTPERYDLYVRSGKNVAEKLGVLPNEAQAGIWGNWRDFAGMPTDFDPTTFDELKQLSYNPDNYAEILEEVRRRGL